MKLTKMERAALWQVEWFNCLRQTYSFRPKTCAKLAAKGLLENVAEDPRGVPAYRLTPAGQSWIIEWERSQ